MNGECTVTHCDEIGMETENEDAEYFQFFAFRLKIEISIKRDDLEGQSHIATHLKSASSKVGQGNAVTGTGRAIVLGVITLETPVVATPVFYEHDSFERFLSCGMYVNPIRSACDNGWTSN